MIDASAFRDGMALLSGAVTVVTTDGGAGAAGFTATAVCSVTDSPPTLLVCMNRSSFLHPTFVTNGVLCVNLLSADQQALSGVFAARDLTAEQRFARAHWTRLDTGSPALDDALVNFDCTIDQSHDMGSHTVFYCLIKAIRHNPGPGGLVYFNRAYHHLGDASRAPA